MIVISITFFGVNFIFIFISIKNIMSQFKLVLHYDTFKNVIWISLDHGFQSADNNHNKL